MENKKIIDSSTIGSIKYVEQHSDARDDIDNFTIADVSVDLSGTVFDKLADVTNQ